MTTMNDEMLSSTYQQKTDKQHILDAPDTYVGSIEPTEVKTWVFDNDSQKIVLRDVVTVEALCKMYDECIINTRDHFVRMKTQKETNPSIHAVNNIDITVSEDGTLVMRNDGNGIDIVKHPQYEIWIPEMIFGHLRTSTNYNKEEKKIVGGKNGFGIKLVFIWSTMGSITTVDSTRQLSYHQTFSNNLDVISEPVIKSCKTKPYTQITFKPDYARLGLTNGITPDIISLFRKRVYDIAAVTDKSVKVKYNGDLIPVKTFAQYVDMYVGDKSDTLRIHESINDRWEYVVCLTPVHEFVQVSFVNGIYTSKGGKHVEYILNQITKKLGDYIEKKKKVKVNTTSIKEQIMLFIRCDIENPAFDSQTKDYMNTPSPKFGSKCEVSDKFIDKIAKLGIMDAACALTEIKEIKIAKKSDGNKTKTIRGIPKLVDANYAGTANSHLCTLILCEGDSAQSGILSGLTAEDRNVFGIYPLRGKLMNVRGEASSKVVDNKEITEIKKILGLEARKTYTKDTVKTQLRYSSVIFMTDQDLDGSHIKGLCINLFENEWKSLFQIPGFLGYINTPIYKAQLNKQQLEFYNDYEYETWKTDTPSSEKWKISYYKGLGSSTSKEFREYMKQKRIISFYATEESNNIIDLIFNKKRADDRKKWLEDYDSATSRIETISEISYESFANNEMILYSLKSISRSIPSIWDGFKPSQRKIVYAAFKKKLSVSSPLKVAQFGGYISEHTCYHHGEKSLFEAIVCLAQNFMGTNNINLLYPLGQFGTRYHGGDDKASERYIFTHLCKITRLIFNEMDDNIVRYLDEDGYKIEPEHYLPILPMVLVNGANGIGTGYSTNILCYNPMEIVDYLRTLLLNKTEELSRFEFIPYYDGFTGRIERMNETKFMVKGVYRKISATKIVITELPIGVWSNPFKVFVEELICNNESGKANYIRDIKDNCTDTKVLFEIVFANGAIAALESEIDANQCNGIERLLKLFSICSNTNMRLFNCKNKLTKYEKVQDILDEFYVERLYYYELRKQFVLQQSEKELNELHNKTRFMTELIDKSLDISNKQELEIIAMLEEREYDKKDDSYDYLLDMKLKSLTKEKITLLKTKYNNTIEVVETLRLTTNTQMWLSDLDEFCEEYHKMIREKREDN